MLKRNNNGNIIIRSNGLAAAKGVINEFSLFFGKFTPNLDIQQIKADQMLLEIPTELEYEQRTVFRKNNQ